MKKILLSIFLSSLIVNVYCQFPINHLAVSEITNSNKGGSTLNLSVYDLNGNLIESSALGNQNFFVSGTAINEGILTLSSDNKILTLYGYNKISNNTGGPAKDDATTTNRTLAIINENKEATFINFNNIHSGQAPKSALAFPIENNNYGIYLAGAGTGVSAGVQYISYNPLDKSTTIPVSLTKVNTRSIKAFNNQLYISSSFDPSNGPTRLLKVGTGLPDTKDQVAINLPGSAIINLEAPADFVMFGDNLLYIAEENTSTGGIKKLHYNGSEWILLGVIDSGIANDFGFKALTGRLEDGKRVLYAITSGNTGNSIVKITDQTAKDEIVERCKVGLQVDVLARSSASTGFRGIAFTPQSEVKLPVGLISFSAKNNHNGIIINWSTAFESNASHFTILRSSDGSAFTERGSVPAKGITASYQFLDKNILSGTYYYQLKQIDLNGRSELFGPIKATIGVNTNEIVVSHRDGKLNISSPAFLANTKIEIVDMNGKVLLSNTTNIQSGINSFPLSFKPNGLLYIVRLNNKDTTIAKKILIE